MQAALRLAARGLGRVWPNPSVGCVITDADGRIAGRGWTQPGGRPHAETEALKRAGDRARGGTAYVTLEPCAHHGKTPPCAEALIDAKVARVVAATVDPDPRVDGGGLALLRAAGITVDTGLLEPEALAVTAGFLSRVKDGRPRVTLKLATSLDGKIATRSGDSQWITGDLARARGHLLRATHDVILTGMGTVIADDPALTCRLPGMEGRSPVRVVLGGDRPMPESAAMLKAGPPVWLFSPHADHSSGPEKLFLTNGVPEPSHVLSELAGEGVTRVMVEAGGAVAATFLKAGLVDEIHWFRAPKVIGGDGIDAVAGWGVEQVSNVPEFQCIEDRPLGPDRVSTLRRV